MTPKGLEWIWLDAKGKINKHWKYVLRGATWACELDPRFRYFLSICLSVYVPPSLSHTHKHTAEVVLSWLSVATGCHSIVRGYIYSSKESAFVLEPELSISHLSCQHLISAILLYSFSYLMGPCMISELLINDVKGRIVFEENLASMPPARAQPLWSFTLRYKSSEIFFAWIISQLIIVLYGYVSQMITSPLRENLGEANLMLLV